MESDYKVHFTNLIAEHQRIILKICNSYCKSEDDREDLAQDIVFQLWKSFSTFKPSYKFSTWLYRVALNVAISYYRKDKKHAANIPIENHLIEVLESPPCDNEKEYQISLLEKFIQELPKLDKALVILYLEERTYKEIAEILGITETNVATKINRVKEKLKQNFSQIKN